MNKEKQRIAIAEACGWKMHDHPDAMKLKQGWTMPEKWCINPKGVLRFNHHRPDYLNDLNAIHEAEKVLNNVQRERYRTELVYSQAGRDVFATAAQRAEAFLRTIGKWEDDK
jgi:hypothetical protein